MIWFILLLLMGMTLLVASYISLSIFVLSEAYRIEQEEMQGVWETEKKEG